MQVEIRRNLQDTTLTSPWILSDSLIRTAKGKAGNSKLWQLPSCFPAARPCLFCGLLLWTGLLAAVPSSMWTAIWPWLFAFTVDWCTNQSPKSLACRIPQRSRFRFGAFWGHGREGWWTSVDQVHRLNCVTSTENLHTCRYECRFKADKCRNSANIPQ